MTLVVLFAILSTAAAQCCMGTSLLLCIFSFKERVIEKNQPYNYSVSASDISSASDMSMQRSIHG